MMNKSFENFEPFGSAIDLAFMEVRESAKVVCTKPQSFFSSSPLATV